MSETPETSSRRRAAQRRIFNDEIGDQVLYVMDNGEIRPGVIVRIHRPGYANLQVFTDGSNDGEPNVKWATSIEYSAARTPRTYHRKGDALEGEIIEDAEPAAI